MVLCQVNKTFRNQHFLKQIFRCAHSEHQSSKILYPLETRRLLKVHGNDASVFLQGLITNDMRHFEEGAKSMYAMFLNNKGRVMYDTLIYKWGDENTFMLECDKNVLNLIQKHLRLYKLKRQVEIHEVNPDFRLWALISHSTQEITDIKSNINIFKDPRLLDLGYRVLSSTPLEVSEIIKAIGMDIEIKENEEGYKYLRYKLGVSEGVEDLPPASSFPLEVNCDYLHGVSFHKGCYIGQELTARVHHTGVVRKRIMPLKFTEEIKENLQKDTVITTSNNPKSNLGKLKGFIRDYGLGIIRTKEALDANLLNIGKYSAVAVKPNWWPVEAPKEKINVLKTE